MLERTQLAHIAQANERGTMDADELRIVEETLVLGEAPAHAVGGGGRVHPHVVAIGLEPAHVVHGDDANAAVYPQRQVPGRVGR